MSNHTRFGIPSETIFEQSRELTVSVVDVTTFVARTEGIDDISQSKQGTVNSSTLF